MNRCEIVTLSDDDDEFNKTSRNNLSENHVGATVAITKETPISIQSLLAGSSSPRLSDQHGMCTNMQVLFLNPLVKLFLRIHQTVILLFHQLAIEMHYRKSIRMWHRLRRFEIVHMFRYF